MLNNTNQLLKINSSFSGIFLYKLDRCMHNAKIYIKRHSISIEILFLLIYTGINLTLVYFIKDRIISVFIILFLFFLGLERLIIHLKSKMEKEEIEKKEEQIKENFSSYIADLEKSADELENENNILKRKICILEFRLEKSKDKR